MFADRTEAGRALADRLAGMDLADPVIFALPRGGVPVALPVADRLNAPLDLLLVRKLGAPGQPELAVGAVVEGAEPVINASVLRAFGLAPGDLAAQRQRRTAHWPAGQRLGGGQIHGHRRRASVDHERLPAVPRRRIRPSCWRASTCVT